MNREKVYSWVIFLLIVGAVLVGSTFFNRPTDPKMKVWFLNVGQGDSSYLKFPDGEDALIDGGPGNKVLTELGKVMPYYDKDLDLVILTHNHSDHLSGLLEVLKRYTIKEVWISGAIHTSNEYIDFLRLLKEKKIKTTIVKEGVEKNFDQVKVRVIYPDKSWQGIKPQDQHLATVVTRWTYGKFSLLETGDLGEEEIDKIIGSGEEIEAKILKVPHHGSVTGLTTEFIERIKPEVAVISAGEHNRYGHPAKKIISLLQEHFVKIYRTDVDGRVGFGSDGLGYERLK